MEVLLHPAGKRRSMARRAFIAGRRSAAVRGSMARPQPIAERRSSLARPRSTVVRHFTAAVRMAAEDHISRRGLRMAVVAVRMAAEDRISRWGLHMAVVAGRTAAGMAAATAAEAPVVQCRNPGFCNSRALG
jgi:hypothetical protein